MDGNTTTKLPRSSTITARHAVPAVKKAIKTTVDIHTHLWESTSQLGPDAAQWLRTREELPWERANGSTSLFNTAMQTVEYAVILGFESRQLGVSIPAEQIAQYVAHDRGKYLGFVGIDPLGDRSLKDLDRAIELGLVGVTISPSVQGFHPCHTQAMRLYEHCEAAGLPIFVHPGTHFGATTRMEYDQPCHFDEPARTFPNLRWVIAQGGYPWVDQAIVLIGKHQHIYAELSCLTSQPWLLYNTLVRAHEAGVMNKLLFGSDFPFATPEQAIVEIYSVNTLAHGTMMPTIPREQLRGIVERDALGCLGIPRPARQEGDLRNAPVPESGLEKSPDQTHAGNTNARRETAEQPLA